jgi:hypothetical protein
MQPNSFPLNIMQNPIPLPIHFKLPGRSYSQIGRKGNVALYSVYSDYFILPTDALPFALIGYELIAITTKNGREIYPPPRLFGESAWSIPKRFARACFARTRCRGSQRLKLLRCTFETLLDRSTTSPSSARLAPSQPQTNQKAPEWDTIVTQRRVTLR